MKRLPGLVTAAVVLAILAGCTAVDGTSKAGGEGVPLTLTIATPDDQDRPAGKQILHFADEVQQRSGGRIRIEPVWNAAGEGATGWDQKVAHRVTAGDSDMALVATRAWDVLGVKSLTALNAPFLVTDERLAASIAQSDLADQLMAGLSRLDVQGLVLLPESLRRPFGYDVPLLGLADYAGAEIRAPYSETTYATFRALGARPTDDNPNPSTMRGGESSFDFAPANVATGNVILFPKINVLVINTQTRKQLTEEQDRLLRDAATATRTWAVTQQPSDLDAARTWCAAGGKIAAASAADIASLQRAVQPVMASLRHDPGTASAIDRITAMKADITPRNAVTSCSGLN
jgi:TRAP-type C4-dicarboxylate transport system substrate-binding protein